MDIFETLRLEHADMRRLLEDLINSTMEPNKKTEYPAAGEEWPEALHDLKVALVAHNRAEEAVFYDALETLAHRKELSADKTEEHHQVEEFLEDLQGLNPLDKDWDMRISLLKNQFESHIAEEETMVFNVLMPHVDDETSDKMAKDFERLREEIVEGLPYHPKGRSIINPAGLDLEGS